ncbi:hypothetical protein E4L95_10895 [Paracoccus liaowanqingii]|uniref:Uncharacterized protein n=1 Tax=Paracoccus liaowanqingii TaxID=2560053 RepID=A0A4Z1CAH9_9RHOB|nr:hypothetical protein [Paracoccus liaowanqingii]TGN60125.1 hypothetical protein E4L95_10895 [Paracoccus liaowanqingii]
MEEHEFQGMFLEAGMPEDHIDAALTRFHAYGDSPKILSRNDYVTAKAIYAVMDARVDPDDAHSPVGRYLISLGARIADWEDKIAQLTP